MGKKIKSVMVRLDSVDAETLGDMAEKTGMKAAALGGEAVRAALRFWRQNDKIELPFRVEVRSVPTRVPSFMDPTPPRWEVNDPPPPQKKDDEKAS